MKKCIEKGRKAAEANQSFAPFSLQDCHPKRISDKLANGDWYIRDAALHTSERMVRQVYDRRKVRVAKPTLQGLIPMAGMKKGLAAILIAANPLILAEWTGLEPATPGVTGRYSNQLNYHSW